MVLTDLWSELLLYGVECGDLPLSFYIQPKPITLRQSLQSAVLASCAIQNDIQRLQSEVLDAG